MGTKTKGKTVALPFFESTPEREWEDMPEFIQEAQEPHQAIIVRFASAEDVEKFAELTEQNITPKTKSMWYPKLEQKSRRDKKYVDEE